MLEEIVEKISSQAGITKDDVSKKIYEKQEELSGLISEEGAAYIVAKELGISLLKTQDKIKIKNLVPGMKNVDIAGKIMKIVKKEFSSAKGSGNLAIVILGDETGTVRLTLWNDELEKLDEIKEGDVVQIRGIVREDNVGNPQLMLGFYGSMQKIDAEISVEKKDKGRRYHIAELKEGNAEVRAALVHVFEAINLYEVCPECGARIKRETNFTCEEHGEVRPAYSMNLSGIMDDGTANIRIVFFGENAEKIVNMKINEVSKMDNRSIANLVKKIELGKEYVFEGKVRKNAFFNRLEFIASDVKNFDVKREIEMIIGDVYG